MVFKQMLTILYKPKFIVIPKSINLSVIELTSTQYNQKTLTKKELNRMADFYKTIYDPELLNNDWFDFIYTKYFYNFYKTGSKKSKLKWTYFFKSKGIYPIDSFFTRCFRKYFHYYYETTYFYPPTTINYFFYRHFFKKISLYNHMYSFFNTTFQFVKSQRIILRTFKKIYFKKSEIKAQKVMLKQMPRWKRKQVKTKIRKSKKTLTSNQLAFSFLNVPSQNHFISIFNKFFYFFIFFKKKKKILEKLKNFFSSHLFFNNYFLIENVYNSLTHFDNVLVHEDIFIINPINHEVFFKMDYDLISYIVFNRKSNKLLITKKQFFKYKRRRLKKTKRYRYKKKFLKLFFKKYFLSNVLSLNNISKKTKKNLSFFLNYNSNFTYFNNTKIPIAYPVIFNKFSTKNHFTNYNNYNYNNFYPVFLHKNIFINKLSIIYSSKSYPKYSTYFLYYLIFFLETFLNKKVYIKLNSYLPLNNEIYNYFKKISRKNRFLQTSIGKHFYVIEFYEILFSSLITRDLKFFSLWFKHVMEKLHISKHKKMCRAIKNTLKNYPVFLKSTGVKGFSLDIRGKLGVAGNAKKRHYHFYEGSLEFTTKNHGLMMYQTTVRTHTGVLGVTLYLSF